MSYIVQGTGQWLAQRVGKLTASRMADAMAVLKNGKPAATRAALLKELLAERITGDAVPHFVSGPMKHGIECEPLAKDEYEEFTGEILVPCGFIEHPTIPNFGATPDALRGSDGVAEIKCPQTSTHIEWILAGEVPEQHRPQILAQLACTRRTRALFISFDPRIVGNKRMFIKEWTPEPEEIAAVECAARDFLAELESMWGVLSVSGSEVAA